MRKSMILIFVMLTAFYANAQMLVNTDFENGKQGDWSQRGSAQLKVTDTAAHSGKNSLFISGRSASWNGPAYDLTGKIFPGGLYKFSAWVMIKPGMTGDEIIMTIERSKSGTSSWDRIVLGNGKPGEWLNLTGEYDAKSAFDKVLVYIESSNSSIEYYIDDITISVIKAPPLDTGKKEIENIPSLFETYKNYFQIGTCIEPNQLNGLEGEMLKKHFSSLTAENVMKPQSLSFDEKIYNFSSADKIVDYAVANNKLVRGHTLVWHQQTAKWMFVDSKGNLVSKSVLLKRLENYIKTVVGHFKGKVYAWDVVNEVVDGADLRNSDWYTIAGEEYIEKAFIYARKADPKAKLFINDYSTTDPVKGKALYDLVKRLKAKKIPVDGIGMQFHINLTSPGLKEIENSLKMFDSLGVEIHITELDLSINGDPSFKPDNAPEKLLIRQAYRYKEIFDIFKKFKSITNVTFWGFQDGHTWLSSFPIIKSDWPLLFDKELKAKYAYWGLVDPSKLPKDVDLEVKRNDFTTKAVKGTPTIDGVDEDLWKKAPDTNISLMVQGKGSTGVGKVLWDDNNIYVLVKVKDNKLSKISKDAYQQDSVEIFVDEKNNKSIEYEEDDAQYRINFSNDISVNGNPSKIKSVALITKDGYNIEVMIPFKFVKPNAGLKLGFDLQINDDSGDGTRTSISKWNDPTNDSYMNTFGFGTLILE